MNHKLVLGTANLGQHYGVTNKSYSENESQRIILAAFDRGIKNFDTSPDYGISESLLGSTIPKSGQSKIVTKIPKMDSYKFDDVMFAIKGSLKRLRVESLHGILFHDPHIYKKEISDVSKRILESGFVEKIGFSAYDEESVIQALDKFPEWRIFQVPENILDRRLINSSAMSDLAKTGAEIYVRSIFLQGVLLEDFVKLPARIRESGDAIRIFQQIASLNNLQRLDLCLSYGSSISWSSGVVVGASTVAQLSEILGSKTFSLEKFDFPKLDHRIIDPRNWNLL